LAMLAIMILPAAWPHDAGRAQNDPVHFATAMSNFGIAAKCLRVALLDGRSVHFRIPQRADMAAHGYGADSCAGRRRNHTWQTWAEPSELDADTGLTTDDETRRSEQFLFH
jgi:hypothetical protein